MVEIKIKPLSTNRTHIKTKSGGRCKSKEYVEYEEQLLWLLPRIDFPKKNIILYIEWGLSSKLADIDNPTKPFLDILEKKYDFNDKEIFDLHLRKVMVPKGNEYIKFNVASISA